MSGLENDKSEREELTNKRLKESRDPNQRKAFDKMLEDAAYDGLVRLLRLLPVLRPSFRVPLYQPSEPPGRAGRRRVVRIRGWIAAGRRVLDSLPSRLVDRFPKELDRFSHPFADDHVVGDKNI